MGNFGNLHEGLTGTRSRPMRNRTAAEGIFPPASSKILNCALRSFQNGRVHYMPAIGPNLCAICMCRRDVTPVQVPYMECRIQCIYLPCQNYTNRRNNLPYLFRICREPAVTVYKAFDLSFPPPSVVVHTPGQVYTNIMSLPLIVRIV